MSRRADHQFSCAKFDALLRQLMRLKCRAHHFRRHFSTTCIKKSQVALSSEQTVNDYRRNQRYIDHEAKLGEKSDLTSNG
jgi:hypothetical protein